MIFKLKRSSSSKLAPNSKTPTYFGGLGLILLFYYFLTSWYSNCSQSISGSSIYLAEQSAGGSKIFLKSFYFHTIIYKDGKRNYFCLFLIHSASDLWEGVNNSANNWVWNLHSNLFWSIFTFGNSFSLLYPDAFCGQTNKQTNSFHC